MSEFIITNPDDSETKVKVKKTEIKKPEAKVEEKKEDPKKKEQPNKGYDLIYETFENYTTNTDSGREEVIIGQYYLYEKSKICNINKNDVDMIQEYEFLKMYYHNYMKKKCADSFCFDTTFNLDLSKIKNYSYEPQLNITSNNDLIMNIIITFLKLDEIKILFDPIDETHTYVTILFDDYILKTGMRFYYNDDRESYLQNFLLCWFSYIYTFLYFTELDDQQILNNLIQSINISIDKILFHLDDRNNIEISNVFDTIIKILSTEYYCLKNFLYLDFNNLLLYNNDLYLKSKDNYFNIFYTEYESQGNCYGCQGYELNLDDYLYKQLLFNFDIDFLLKLFTLKKVSKYFYISVINHKYGSSMILIDKSKKYYVFVEYSDMEFSIVEVKPIFVFSERLGQSRFFYESVFLNSIQNNIHDIYSYYQCFILFEVVSQKSTYLDYRHKIDYNITAEVAFEDNFIDGSKIAYGGFNNFFSQNYSFNNFSCGNKFFHNNWKKYYPEHNVENSRDKIKILTNYLNIEIKEGGRIEGITRKKQKKPEVAKRGIHARKTETAEERRAKLEIRAARALEDAIAAAKKEATEAINNLAKIAETIEQDATNARTAANNAVQHATDARAAADNAGKYATDARAAANKIAADKAVEKATANEAAGTAEEKAKAAKEAAGTAEEKAKAANEAAGTAEEKAKAATEKINNTRGNIETIGTATTIQEVNEKKQSVITDASTVVTGKSKEVSDELKAANGAAGEAEAALDIAKGAAGEAEAALAEANLAAANTKEEIEEQQQKKAALEAKMAQEEKERQARELKKQQEEEERRRKEELKKKVILNCVKIYLLYLSALSSSLRGFISDTISKLNVQNNEFKDKLELPSEFDKLQTDCKVKQATIISLNDVENIGEEINCLTSHIEDIKQILGKFKTSKEGLKKLLLEKNKYNTEDEGIEEIIITNLQKYATIKTLYCLNKNNNSKISEINDGDVEFNNELKSLTDSIKNYDDTVSAYKENKKDFEGKIKEIHDELSGNVKTITENEIKNTGIDIVKGAIAAEIKNLQDKNNLNDGNIDKIKSIMKDYIPVKYVDVLTKDDFFNQLVENRIVIKLEDKHESIDDYQTCIGTIRDKNYEKVTSSKAQIDPACNKIIDELKKKLRKKFEKRISEIRKSIEKSEALDKAIKDKNKEIENLKKKITGKEQINTLFNSLKGNYDKKYDNTSTEINNLFNKTKYTDTSSGKDITFVDIETNITRYNEFKLPDNCTDLENYVNFIEYFKKDEVIDKLFDLFTTNYEEYIKEIKLQINSYDIIKSLKDDKVLTDIDIGSIKTEYDSNTIITDNMEVFRAYFKNEYQYSTLKSLTTDISSLIAIYNKNIETIKANYILEDENLKDRIDKINGSLLEINGKVKTMNDFIKDIEDKEKIEAKKSDIDSERDAKVKEFKDKIVDFKRKIEIVFESIMKTSQEQCNSATKTLKEKVEVISKNLSSFDFNKVIQSKVAASDKANEAYLQGISDAVNAAKKMGSLNNNKSPINSNKKKKSLLFIRNIRGMDTNVNVIALNEDKEPEIFTSNMAVYTNITNSIAHDPKIGGVKHIDEKKHYIGKEELDHFKGSKNVSQATELVNNYNILENEKRDIAHKINKITKTAKDDLKESGKNIIPMRGGAKMSNYYDDLIMKYQLINIKQNNIVNDIRQMINDEL